MASLTSSLNPITVHETDTTRASLPHGAIAATERVSGRPSVEIVALCTSRQTREKQNGVVALSYTHLTLPTICSV